jgi:nitrogen fixation NifU-like protein
VYLDVEDGTLKNIKMVGSGCSISQSSASLMSSAVKGKSLDQVRATIAMFKQLMTVQESTLAHDGEAPKVDLRTLGELAALQGVIKFPVRIKCATLAWNTLIQGLDELN